MRLFDGFSAGVMVWYGNLSGLWSARVLVRHLLVSLLSVWTLSIFSNVIVTRKNRIGSHSVNIKYLLHFLIFVESQVYRNPNNRDFSTPWLVEAVICASICYSFAAELS